MRSKVIAVLSEMGLNENMYKLYEGISKKLGNLPVVAVSLTTLYLSKEVVSEKLLILGNIQVSYAKDARREAWNLYQDLVKKIKLTKRLETLTEGAVSFTALGVDKYLLEYAPPTGDSFKVLGRISEIMANYHFLLKKENASKGVNRIMTDLKGLKHITRIGSIDISMTRETPKLAFCDILENLQKEANRLMENAEISNLEYGFIADVMVVAFALKGRSNALKKFIGFLDRIKKDAESLPTEAVSKLAEEFSERVLTPREVTK